LRPIGGTHRVPFVVGDDAEEIALAHHAGARNVGDRARIDARDPGAVPIGALPARAHDAAVEHVGHAHVLHVDVLAAHLVGNVDARHAGADQPIVGDRLLRRLAGHLHVELLRPDEVAVRDGAGRLAGDRNDAADDLEPLRRRAEPGGGEPQQRLARLRGRGPQLRPVVHDGEARDGRTLVRRHVGIDPHGPELAHVEVELLAGDLQHAGGGALAELDLAEEHRRGVVGMHRDPGIQIGGIGCGSAHGGAQQGEQRRRHAEGDHEGATLEEIAARQRRGGERGHVRSSAMMREASLIAAMMRG
jgi:hypothetical protein